MSSTRMGRYEVLARLQKGGMAELSLAATAGPGGFRKFVVLKRILPEAAGDENFVKMFLDEARVTGAFSHPGICQVFELENDPKTGLFVAMEFIAGQDLNQVVGACARQRAVLPVGFSASVVHDCALALHYAHTFRLPNGDDSPVVHRDVAQKNIMVTYEGQVKLLDFGIAKAKGALARTRAGTVKGTAGYMSPEQVRGEPLDGRSDVFSLGVVLWEMATGRRLFSADTELAELKLILSHPVVPPIEVEPSVPAELSAVVMKALDRDRDVRFRSAKEMARSLATTCGELLFDADERAAFMKERFAEKIASARRLFDVASSQNDAEVDAAVEEFRRSTTSHDNAPETAELEAPPRPSPPVVRARPVPKVAGLGESTTSRAGRSKKARNPAPSPPLPLQTAQDVPVTSPPGRAATEAMVKVASPPSAWRVWPVLAVALALGVGALVWRQMQQGVEVEPTVDAPLPDEVTPPTEGDPGRAVDATKRGDVTLAFIPEATVSKGSQRLGQGSVVNFALPVGSHQVSVVFKGGERRKLFLKVTAGKNKIQRYRPDDLPTDSQ